MGVPWVGCNEGCGEQTVGGDVSTGPAPPQWLGIWGNVQCTYGGLCRYKWFTISFQGSLLSGEYQADGRDGSQSGLALRQRGLPSSSMPELLCD